MGGAESLGEDGEFTEEAVYTRTLVNVLPDGSFEVIETEVTASQQRADVARRDRVAEAVRAGVPVEDAIEIARAEDGLSELAAGEVGVTEAALVQQACDDVNLWIFSEPSHVGNQLCIGHGGGSNSVALSSFRWQQICTPAICSWLTWYGVPQSFYGGANSGSFRRVSSGWRDFAAWEVSYYEPRPSFDAVWLSAP